MNQIAVRPNIEAIVAAHDKTIELYADAYAKMEIAQQALCAANAIERTISPTLDRNGYTSNHINEIKAFAHALQLPEREDYMRAARRIMQLKTWAYLIERTELEALMDIEAKNKLRKQMAYVPERRDYTTGAIINQDEIDAGMPPVTVENLNATLDQFMADAGTIWLRGIANAFSKLDRRFKSHDGFKIGARIILTYAFTDSGGWNWGSGRGNTARDTLIDIERVFTIMDGKKPPRATYAGAIGSIDAIRLGFNRPAQCEVETPYFKIRVFKNGNAHLWMIRKDLVKDVNKALAFYYGEVLPDGGQAEEDPLQSKAVTPAKRFGFFPTPDKTVDEVFRQVSLLRKRDEPQMRILEPSAGTGQLARRCLRSIEELDGGSGGRARYEHEYRYDHAVECVELQPHLADGLKAEGVYRRVYNQDFLTLSPTTTGLYDYVVMNPPFDMLRDIDHVHHALKFLKDNGTLVAIMSAGVEFREDKKSAAFRDLVINKMKGRFFDLPPGSFAESGTYVNTVFLKVYKSGRPVSHY
ncbi:DUF4942 domain-containing protein [Rhizobium azibense]|uniref:Uncharacterized protein DUF4942 n=1 Tax=Rhizobium azibense TaxID=1136135 RepID=A0A4R3RI27_9HYPH|nr:DUF4942 domain-containing protein [Rhizobium azibense]TCU34087.1 uncharacterized protein DUF4942 [Rhizobium azibense]